VEIGVARAVHAAGGEVVDPTGQDRRTWLDVFELVDDLTRRLAKALT
jgi:protein-tyrosine-phosphatase